MRIMTQNPAMRWVEGAIALTLTAVAAGVPLWAQQVSSAAANTGAPQGTVLDRVVAVVNGDVILESDIDEERRFQLIQPFRMQGEFSRERAVQRLVDRTLIQQQADIQPEAEVTDQELNEELASLRKEIPECKEYHCESDAGWQKLLGEHGFTVAQFRDRWRIRMELLRFIEVRFRNGIHITDDQIKDYYEKTMLPEYERQKMAPPKMETISHRIQEVLMQQQVSNLLRDWLASLRAQGSVRIIKPNEVGR